MVPSPAGLESKKYQFMNLKQMIPTIILLVLLAGIVGWKMYHDKNIKTETLDASTNKNQEVIGNLIKYGSDPEKDHLIEFFFYGDADRLRLNELKDYLISQGYEEMTGHTDQALVVTKSYKLHLDVIGGVTKRMEELAKEYDVEFDGWGASVVK